MDAAVAGWGGHIDSRIGRGSNQLSSVCLAHVRDRSAVRVQPHDAGGVSRRSWEAVVARRVARWADTGRGSDPYGACRSVVVGVGMASVVGRDAADELGLAGLHHATVQPLLTA